jgi:hypothetical protein
VIASDPVNETKTRLVIAASLEKAELHDADERGAGARIEFKREVTVARVSGCYALSQPRRTQGSGASGALSLSASIADHRTSGGAVYERCAASTGAIVILDGNAAMAHDEPTSQRNSPRNRWFESGSLQQGVCLCTEPQRLSRRVPWFCGGLLVQGDERREGLAANSSLFAFFLWRALAQSHPEDHSHANAVADCDDAPTDD